MPALNHAAPRNRLIAALPDRSRRHVLASCEQVQLVLAQVLYESGGPIRDVYFPLNCVISLVTSLDDGAQLEVGIVGNEGMLGTPLVLGVRNSLQHAVVQGAGAALRMSAAAFRRHCKEDAVLRQAMNLYIQVRMNQLAQTAACTHRHDVESRVARWMLMTRDRALSNCFHLTHEFLAEMLGVRRVGITQAASSLQGRGLISYRRGEIVILNGAGLGKASCLCYGRGKAMYAQTMGVHASTALCVSRKGRKVLPMCPGGIEG